MQRIGRTWIAGSSIGTRKNRQPCCFFSPLWVRASRKHHCAIVAYDVQIFWPLTSQPSPSVRGGAQRREVGARLRLGKALTPDDFAPRDGRQVLLLLLLGAVPHDDRADPVDAHVLGAARLVVGPHLLAHHGLLPHRRPAAAEILRPRQAQQVAFGQCPAELLGRLEVGRVVGEGAQKVLGHMTVHQLTQIASQVGGLPAPSQKSTRRPYPEPTAGSMSAESSPALRAPLRCRRPARGSGPAIRPGVRENQVGTPGIRTGPYSVSTVSNSPTAFRCGWSNSASGVLIGAAGIQLAEQCQPLVGRALQHRLGQQSVDGVDVVGAQFEVAYSSVAQAGRTAPMKAFQCLSL